MNDANKASFTASNLYKEEMPARKISYAKDRKIISENFQTCIDPLNPTDYPQNINFATGQIAPDPVKRDCAVYFVQKWMKKYRLAYQKVFTIL